jgi:hypothetical protein
VQVQPHFTNFNFPPEPVSPSYMPTMFAPIAPDQAREVNPVLMNRRKPFPVRVLISDSGRRQRCWNDLVTMPVIDMEIAVCRKDQAIVAQFAHSHQAHIGY